jgi:hypothetical protein
MNPTIGAVELFEFVCVMLLKAMPLAMTLPIVDSGFAVVWKSPMLNPPATGRAAIRISDSNMMPRMREPGNCSKGIRRRRNRCQHESRRTCH